MVLKNGLQCLKEIPRMITAFRLQTADVDITQAYPNGELIANISKETTAIELNLIHGVDDGARRRAGINLTAGKVNSIEICNELLLMPDIHKVLMEFMKDKEKGLIQ